METELISVWQALSWTNIHEFMQRQIMENEFSQGALMAGIIGAILAWGRGIPGAIWSFLKRVFTLEVRFNSDSADYEVIQRWVAQNMVREFWSRRFVFQTEIEFDHDEWREKAKSRSLTAGYGQHFGMWEGRPCLIHRSIEEANQTKEFKENLEITFLGRDRKMVHRFAEKLREVTGTQAERFENVPLFINDGGYWNRMGKLPLRHMNSVITANKAGDHIVEIIRDFESKKEEHHRMGLPHHLGIMLHGVPGTGKSSLIHAIATETQRKVHYLNLGSVDDDGELTRLLSSARTNWGRAILAIEDIDAAGVKVKRESKPVAGASKKAKKSKKGKKKEEEGGSASSEDSDSKVSLSALLNVLDGMLCPDGLVVVATTNHYDKLDPALIRSGRFDHTIELKDLGEDEFIEMCHLLGRNPSDFDIDTRQRRTGAEMRSIILGTA